MDARAVVRWAACMGKRDSGSAVAPVNAVSHWLWGDKGARGESSDQNRRAIEAQSSKKPSPWAILSHPVHGTGSLSVC